MSSHHPDLPRHQPWSDPPWRGACTL